MERRKDPVLKKIVLLCSVAALVAIYCFSAYSELSQLPTNLSVNEEEARSIMESRALRLVAPSEDEGIPDLKINGIAPLYDAETSTFYYSLSDDSRRWPSLHFTLNGEEVDGQLAFLEDFMSESREAALAESTRIPFILYDDETYRQYYLTFSTLPLMQITLDEFPEDKTVVSTLEETEEEPEWLALDYDELLSPDAPIGREDSFAHIRLLDPKGDEHGYGTEFTSDARIHVRGRSSVQYPKNSYRLELLIPDENDPSLLIENKAELLGMRNDGDWVLNGMYAESTKIREKLSAEVWRNIRADQNDPGLSPGYSVEYVEVFIGNRYWGVYGLSERIDEKQLGLEEGDRLYWSVADQGAPSSAFYQVESLYCKGYELRYPETVESSDLWEPFRQLVYLSKEAGYEERDEYWSALADEESAADYLLYILAVAGVDNVIQNTYFVYRADTGQFTFLPWDMDQTFGNAWQGSLPLLTGEDYTQYGAFRDEWWVTNNLLKKGGAGFNSLLQTRYRELRRGALSEDTLLSIVDDCERQLDASGVLYREQERWPEGAQDTNTSPLKGYIRFRMKEMDRYVKTLPTDKEDFDAQNLLQ